MGTTNTFSPHPRQWQTKNLPATGIVSPWWARARSGWSALWLLRAGYKVTLIDAWGRATPGRAPGTRPRHPVHLWGQWLYFDLNVRALSLWKEHQALWNTNCFIMWASFGFATTKNPLVDASIPLPKAPMEYEYLSVADIQKRYPWCTGSLSHAWHDPMGLSESREATQAVQEAL